MRRCAVFGTLILAACGQYVPPTPPAPRAATRVSASLGRTWDAVVELFATRSIPIRTMERASGFIATEQLYMTLDDSRRYADCGSPPPGATFYADRASYNVLVRGDSSSSTVLVTTHFRESHDAGQCVSTGRWEREFETAVEARAEGRPIATTVTPSSSSPPEECSQLNTVDRDGDDWRVRLYRVNGAGQCVRKKECRYREGATVMSSETALARCYAEAKQH